MPAPWPELPYDAWHETRDTLHAHTQVLGKLATALAPPEPQLQHAALRLTTRGWETAPLPAPDGSGAFSRRARSPYLRGGGAAQRRARAAHPAHARSRRRRGHARAAGLRAADRGGGGAQPHAAGDALDDAAGQRRGARLVRHGPGRRLLRGRDARRDGAGRAARSLPRSLDAGQRLVGIVRPRREPVFRASPSSPRAKASSGATRAMPSKSRSAGGPGMRATGARPSTPTPCPRPRGSRTPRSSLPRRTGMPISASSSWTGMTSATIPTPMRARSRSRAPRSYMRARCAAGIRPWQPAPRAFRRPSSEA